MWLTEEFGNSHEGQPGVVLADGNLSVQLQALAGHCLGELRSECPKAGVVHIISAQLPRLTASAAAPCP